MATKKNDIAKELDKMALEYAELTEQKNKAEARLKILKKQLLEEMKGEPTMILQHCSMTTWNQIRTIVDTDKLKADNLYDKYSVSSTATYLKVLKRKEI